MLSNCIHGKTFENIRRRINVKLINDKRMYQKFVDKPSFISSKIIDKNLVADFEQANLCWILHFRVIKVINV